MIIPKDSSQKDKYKVDAFSSENEALIGGIKTELEGTLKHESNALASCSNQKDNEMEIGGLTGTVNLTANLTSKVMIMLVG